LILEIVPGIGLDPKLVAQCGAYTLVAVETLKRYVPSLFPAGSSASRSVTLPGLAGVAASILGLGPFAGLTWLQAGVTAAIGSVVAGSVHDRVVEPILDPLLDKVPGQGKGARK